MKKRLYFILAGLFLLSVQVNAQAPNLFNYQGVARNSGGSVLATQSIGLEFTIHEGSSGGTVVYQETHTTTTNQFGLFTVAIGNGTVISGSFNTVNWGGGLEYLEVGMDPTGGTSYTSMGTQQLVSVPYAINAGGLTGIGKVNYIPRWNTISTFDTGVIQDDNNTVAIGKTPFGNDMLYVDPAAPVPYVIVGASQSSSYAYGLVGENYAPDSSNKGTGVWGFTYQSDGYGILGENFNTNSDEGIGVLGIGGGSSNPDFNFGEGVLGAGNDYGMMGYATDVSPSFQTAGGFFSCVNETYYANVGYWNGTTNYKIIGTGTVSTIVKDQQNNLKAMACPEAPEILFEDFGTSQLANGTVHINLDPTLAKNVTVNEKHPLRVMITMNDACPNGVYVTNRTTTGFDVVENNNGASNATFTYEVIANRADETDANGKIISKNADIRFPVAPGPLKPKATSASPKSLPPTVRNKNNH